MVNLKFFHGFSLHFKLTLALLIVFRAEKNFNIQNFNKNTNSKEKFLSEKKNDGYHLGVAEVCESN